MNQKREEMVIALAACEEAELNVKVRSMLSFSRV
jgi:hypothetical protein